MSAAKTRDRMKSHRIHTPAAFESGVYASALCLLRVVYDAQVAAMLDIMRPRIQTGEFANIGDSFSMVRAGSPEEQKLPPHVFTNGCDGEEWLEVDVGICLLERAICRLPYIQALMQDRQFVAAVLAVSNHEWDGEQDDEDAAIECLTHDVRALFRASGGTIPGTKSVNWRWLEGPERGARK